MEQQLSEMKIGHTQVIAGKPVTKWSADFFEVNTWGKKMQTAVEALAELR